jgi:hypothetical protein
VWFDLSPAQWRARLEVACGSQHHPRSLDNAVRDALTAAPDMLAANQAADARRVGAGHAQPDLSWMRIPTDRGWAPLHRNGAI